MNLRIKKELTERTNVDIRKLKCKLLIPQYILAMSKLVELVIDKWTREFSRITVS